MCVCVSAKSLSHVWLFVTLWFVACQAPLPTVFSRQEYWSGLSCPPPGDLPDLVVEPASLMSTTLSGGFFIPSTTCEAPWSYRGHQMGLKQKQLVLQTRWKWAGSLWKKLPHFTVGKPQCGQCS